MTTAAGIVAPIAATMPGVSPELLVLATGAGSIILSHVNDSGFWLVKEYMNMSVPQTLKTWTVMETILGCVAFAMVMVLSLFVQRERKEACPAARLHPASYMRPGWLDGGAGFMYWS